MHILTGLFDHGVLQRTNRNVSDAPVTGETDASGAVVARVKRGSATVKGFNNKRVGDASRGKFEARLAGLPTGGPYLVELAILGADGKAADKIAVKDVLVGDVWIAGGQSNMQGCGLYKNRAKKHPLVRAFYMDDHWAVAEDPIHNLEIAVDPVHNGGNRVDRPVIGTAGVGPAVMFAKDMHRRTGVPQGILACAHGGTSMSQWDPKLLNQGGGSLYGASIRRLRKNGGKTAGIIWYQGESDCSAAAAPLYTERMIELVNCYRRDAGDKTLPFVAVQLGRVAGWEDGSWNAVQEAQRRLAEIVTNFSITPAIDLRLDDTIHISGEDQQRLGLRLAYAMDALVRGKKGGIPPITFRKFRLETHPRMATLSIVVEFDNVVGKLRTAPGIRPAGFVICDPNPVKVIWDIELKGDEVHLHTNFARAALSNKSLHYGHGTDPVCNITDAADRLIPVMGPVTIGEQRAITPPMTTLDVAFPIDMDAESGCDRVLNGLKLPPNLDTLPWKNRTFPGPMIDLHTEYDGLKPRDFITYFRCRFEAPEEMKLSVVLGYDGPVKLWVDGKELWHDPHGTNPAWEDRAKAPCNVKAGTHEIVVALASNEAKAWGIFLRLERTDISKALIKKGPSAYVMPRAV
ncbi:MAG: sialate O-acetylesterase [Planctomycetes bacterium]|nr:sialate O-acetylesterase [Planctomycetota bacterium]